MVVRVPWGGDAGGAGIALQLTIVVECKSSETPWALFTNHEVYGAAYDGFYLSLPSHASHDALHGRVDAGHHHVLQPLERHAYRAVETSSPRKENSKQAPTRSVVWDAMRQLLDATDGLAAEEKWPTARPHLTTYLPVIVTNAPLFAVWLNADGQGYEIEPVRMMPLVAYLGTSEPVAGGNRREAAAMWIVSEAALPDFVEKACNTGMQLGLMPQSTVRPN